MVPHARAIGEAADVTFTSHIIDRDILGGSGGSHGTNTPRNSRSPAPKGATYDKKPIELVTLQEGSWFLYLVMHGCAVLNGNRFVC